MQGENLPAQTKYNAVWADESSTKVIHHNGLEIAEMPLLQSQGSTKRKQE